MRTIRVYEPALCCNTGVCGPDVDQALVDFTVDLTHPKGLGVDIERHNLANNPAAFASGFRRDAVDPGGRCDGDDRRLATRPAAN